MTGVRVLSYNIRSMRDDLGALIRVVRGCRPDLVCLQEAPRFALWQVKRHKLASAAGLTVAAGRRAAGIAVLAGPRVRPLHQEHHLLSRRPGLHRRGLALAVVELAAEPEPARLIVASTHLDLVAEPRRAHAAEVLRLLDRAQRSYDAPVVLTGDINEEAGGAAWDMLAGALQDAYAVAPAGTGLTYSARRPRKRIDGVFADKSIEVAGCGVPDDPALAADYRAATDHLPVVADLRLAEPQPKKTSASS